MEDFRGANLNFENFANRCLREVDFTGSWLERVDFTGANLRGANLTDASFERADFTGADLTDVILGSDILGEVDLAKSLKFLEELNEAIQNPKTFDMAEWHSECGTIHCLAGWITTLHPDGEGMEIEKHTADAACEILLKLGVRKMPNFYGTGDEAMDWLEEAIETLKSQSG